MQTNRVAKKPTGFLKAGWKLICFTFWKYFPQKPRIPPTSRSFGIKKKNEITSLPSVGKFSDDDDDPIYPPIVIHRGKLRTSHEGYHIRLVVKLLLLLLLLLQ